MKVRKEYRPLEFFQDYLKSGYYPFSFEKKRTYKTVIENVINYTIDTELTKYRNVSIENTGKIKAFLQVVSGLLPYQVDIAKLSKSVCIDRVTLLRYMKHLAEAKLTRNIYAKQDTITDLQKPDKLMLDNTNQIFSLCSKEPEIGTLRECFFCNQLASAGHKVEYGGIKTGDFRIDNDIVIEVGGASKGMAQISDEDKGADARKACKNACIACKKCEKSCPHAAITVENNLARIDYSKCTGCGKCSEVCPTGCIKKVFLPNIPDDLDPRNIVE